MMGSVRYVGMDKYEIAVHISILRDVVACLTKPLN